MLEHLSVQNYALIEQLDIPFSRGFTVLTGETGAGKSILIGALGLLLGDKVDTSVVRTGAESTAAAAVVTLPDSPSVLSMLEEQGIEPEDGQIIMRRVIKPNARGTITLQGVPVTQRELKEISLMLFDVHGQHEHQSLLKSSAQRSMLDSYGKLQEDVAYLEEGFTRLSSLKKQLEALDRDEKQRLRERDMLSYAVEEIDAAQLKEGEEEELEQQIRIASQYEQLVTHIETAREAVSSSGGALELLKNARGSLERASAIDEKLAAEASRIEEMGYELEDVYELLRGRLDQITLQPGELDEMQDRLQVIRKLEKKYGDSIGEVLSYADNARKSLDELEHSDEKKEKLKAEYTELFDRLRSACRELSEKRKKVAESLEGRITALLRELGMPHGRFIVRITERKNEQGETVYNRTGMDEISFDISPNEGEPAKPVSRIASGGEISRVMLALKSVFAQSDEIDTLIFDEIDAGIGGSVAGNVGMHLGRLGKSRQVICITHLASIAARADAHFVVDKTVSGGRSITSVREVEGEKRVAEIARMLSGDSDQDAALAHARELLQAT